MEEGIFLDLVKWKYLRDGFSIRFDRGTSTGVLAIEEIQGYPVLYEAGCCPNSSTEWLGWVLSKFLNGMVSFHMLSLSKM